MDQDFDCREGLAGSTYLQWAESSGQSRFTGTLMVLYHSTTGPPSPLDLRRVPLPVRKVETGNTDRTLGNRQLLDMEPGSPHCVLCYNPLVTFPKYGKSNRFPRLMLTRRFGSRS